VTVKSPSTQGEITQTRLFWWAGGFLFLFSVVLSLSPAVRLHSWQVDYRWPHWVGFTAWAAGFWMLMRAIRRKGLEGDEYLLPVVAILSGWGLLTIWRLNPTFGLRQTAWLLICLGLFILGLRLPDPLKWLRRYKYMWLTGGLLLTGLTFVLGTYPGGDGPRLWLGCCGIYLQPSEPLKLLLIVYLSAFLADRLPMGYHFSQLLPPTILLTGTALLILLIQRDLGTVSIFLGLFFFTLYLVNNKLKTLAVGAAILLGAGILGYSVLGIIQSRVDTWLNPFFDPAGSGYQILQSLMAIANGAVFGRGPGLGSPGLVPVAISDFIFSAIAEETGLVGVLAMSLLYALLAVRGLRIGMNVANSFKRYLAGGISVYFTLQTILITGGNLNLLPLTGVTLPFVSYGGSSLLVSFTAVFILWHISLESVDNAVRSPWPAAQSVGLILLAGLFATSLTAGWWMVVRGDELLNRPDNPRWIINDRNVRRGSILDRNNQPINSTNGSPGSYSRQYHYLPLSTTSGFTHPAYGLSGLEGSMNAYLNGMDASPSLVIWSSRTLYGQTPPGLDVRLSIDLGLQQKADDLLGDYTGSILLMNAQTGEILVLASHPYINPTAIDLYWQDWVTAKNAPLLNRGNQAQYQPGTAIGPFLLEYLLAKGNLPSPDELQTGEDLPCALPVLSDPSWGSFIRSGCQEAVNQLWNAMTPEQRYELFQALGFTQPPQLPLPVAQPSTRWETASQSTWQNLPGITPMQMVIAAAALSTNGEKPSPLLAMAVNTPNQGWVILPGSNRTPGIPVSGLAQSANLLHDPILPIWQNVSSSQQPQGNTTWYVAGTIPDWSGTPLALVVLLEDNNPADAMSMGTELLRFTLNP
jgi:cell division protein FtsW (lipid II flippase)